MAEVSQQKEKTERDLRNIYAKVVSATKSAFMEAERLLESDNEKVRLDITKAMLTLTNKFLPDKLDFPDDMKDKTDEDILQEVLNEINKSGTDKKVLTIFRSMLKEEPKKPVKPLSLLNENENWKENDKRFTEADKESESELDIEGQDNEGSDGASEAEGRGEDTILQTSQDSEEVPQEQEEE